jgi:hypothetical protein
MFLSSSRQIPEKYPLTKGSSPLHPASLLSNFTLYSAADTTLLNTLRTNMMPFPKRIHRMVSVSVDNTAARFRVRTTLVRLNRVIKDSNSTQNSDRGSFPTF